MRLSFKDLLMFLESSFCPGTHNRLLVLSQNRFAAFVFQKKPLETIGLVVDSLGIRSLRFGDLPWSSGRPEDINCWEGFSQRQEDRRVRIVRDALKFRQLSWCYSKCLSFEESIFMRGKHAFWHGSISRDSYIQVNPHQETELIHEFGNFTTDAVWLDEQSDGITAYCHKGISGLSIQTSSGPLSVGYCNAIPKFFPIHGPDEAITEIDIYIGSPEPNLSITLKTTWNRHVYFGFVQDHNAHCSVRTLRSPKNCHIKGLYFRVGKLSIESLGAIYAYNSYQPTYHSFHPPPVPRIKLKTDEVSPESMETCASLWNIQKVRFYYIMGYCTGLWLFYRSGNSEVVGRINEDYSHELILVDDDSLHQIWLTQAEGKIEEIGFSTDSHMDLEKNNYDITISTAILWRYSKDSDFIQIFDQDMLEGEI
ncbi:hypothetical protein ASPZODRAFT_509932 [Penicilliopsis zonata CBS 506.65]|uniref:Uncharacterized protein n=1 Tax=Penicilliopsis zonata CBS 506.65 TaxID=1073090 RepID=A0A1L9SF19_9EURO|nr:hypothetical protein ASPZODRAFT_509932 [Penicilliopsis zonata CBS 506.65]OJJ45687.1 hypothetical protein ASPZODRAFT_509932 [Penicilliopsis zonata CBS 506.65]